MGIEYDKLSYVGKRLFECAGA